MSFLRHGEIYPCDEGTISRPCPRSSPWMSLQLVIPGRLLSSRARFRFPSRSYTANYQPRLTMLRQRTAKCRLTGCLSRGVQSKFTPSRLILAQKRKRDPDHPLSCLLRLVLLEKHVDVLLVALDVKRPGVFNGVKEVLFFKALPAF
jgi:hypothetical protein